MAYKPKVLTVSEGGTGAVSQTAYTVLCGGTTSTGSIQSIASVGTSGQTLTSNGGGALPTFQTPGGYSFFTTGTSGNPSDSTTYWFAIGFLSTGTNSGSGYASVRFIVPFAGTITAAYGVMTCTTGTSENSTIKLTLNNSTDINITTTLQLNASPATFSNTGLSQAVSAGDYIEVKWVTPAWVTNPSNCRFSCTVYIN